MYDAHTLYGMFYVENDFLETIITFQKSNNNKKIKFIVIRLNLYYLYVNNSTTSSNCKPTDKHGHKTDFCNVYHNKNYYKEKLFLSFYVLNYCCRSISWGEIVYCLH